MIESLTSDNFEYRYHSVLLPSVLIKISDLIIARPILIKGRPGSIVEFTHGSVVIDFETNSVSKEKLPHKEVFVICECDLIFGDRAVAVS